MQTEEPKDSDVTVPLKKPDHLPAVPDHRFNYKRRPLEPEHEQSNCCQKCLIFLTTFFCMSTCALVAVLVWREFSKKDCDPPEPSIPDRFPGFFRTPDELLTFQMILKGVPEFTQVNATFDTYYRCQATCIHGANPNISEIQSIHYYTCCESEISYTMPEYLQNLRGSRRKIVQLKNKYQYVRTETCKQSNSCAGCQCIQNTLIIPLVFEHVVLGKDKHYDVDYFPHPGPCQCLIKTN